MFGIIKCFIKTLIKSVLYLLLFIGFLIYAPFLLDIKPTSYSIPFPEFTGKLAPNDVLSKAEHLFTGEINGPESIAVWRDDVYTALSDGRIIRVRDNKFTTIASTCEATYEGVWEQEKCGRPLAVKFDSKGHLYVIDAYHGLKKIDISSDKPMVTTVFSSKTKVEGKASIFLDDFIIVESETDGNVFYLTDGSAKWFLKDAFYLLLENPADGRIIKYEEKTKKATIVAENLYFPNGIELSDDKQAFYFSEFGQRRILKFHLSGAKKGKLDVVIDKLPGEPDNIRRSSNKEETYWIGIFAGRSNKTVEFADLLTNKPFLRKALTRFIHLISTSIQYVGKQINYVPLIELGNAIPHKLIMNDYSYKHGIAMEIDKNGNIIKTIHSPDGKTTHLSEVREVNQGGKKILYLGSFFNNYLGKLVLS